MSEQESIVMPALQLIDHASILNGSLSSVPQSEIATSFFGLSLESVWDFSISVTTSYTGAGERKREGERRVREGKGSEKELLIKFLQIIII